MRKLFHVVLLLKLTLYKDEAQYKMIIIKAENNHGRVHLEDAKQTVPTNYIKSEIILSINWT